MNYFLLYDLKNGQIASISEGIIVYDKKIFGSKTLDLSEADLEKFKNGFTVFWKNNTLVFIDPQEKQKELKILISNIKSLDDAKNVLLKIINQ